MAFDFDAFDTLCGEALQPAQPWQDALNQVVDAEAVAEAEDDVFDPHIGDRAATMEYQLHKLVLQGTLSHSEAEEHLEAYVGWLEGQETDTPTPRCLGQIGLDL
jgi:hypothetical protein